MTWEFHAPDDIPPKGWTLVYGSMKSPADPPVALPGVATASGRPKAKQQRYGIPTKYTDMRALGLDEIEVYVRAFIEHAKANPWKRFWVTRVACALAGYKDEQVAPLFRDAPSNCCMPIEWRELLRQ